MKKFLAVITAAVMALCSVPTAFAADGGTKGASPIAAYDFTEGDLTELSARGLGALDLTEGGEGVGSRAHAVVYDESMGALYANDGFFSLPDNLFSDAEKDGYPVSGITVSVTIAQENNSDWQRQIFSFSAEDLGHNDWGQETKSEPSFVLFTGGDVGTGSHPFMANGSWTDGNKDAGSWVEGATPTDSILPANEKHTVTVSYDPSVGEHGRVTLYVDGAPTLCSDNAGWDITAELSLEDISKLTTNVIGRTTAGNEGWRLKAYIYDLAVYAQPLTAEQVGTLVSEGWEALASSGGADTGNTDEPGGNTPPESSDVPPATEGGSGKPSTAPKTGFAAAALLVSAIGTGAYVITKRRH